jgi:16S rRNA processing protein RimM
VESEPLEEQRQWVTIAVLLGSRGNRGELKALPFSGHPERFSGLSEVYLFDARRPALELRAVEVEKVWRHGEHLVFKLRGVDSISEAEELKGCEVRVPLSSRAPLAEGEFYQSDLVGCELVERTTGKSVGRVRDWRECGGPLLLEVEGPGGEEILVPFARSICVAIDLAAKRISVDLPEGLLDLDR